eukprot:INCI14046.1.p1 GENE.INCI14046.1~~INCI14046.1.p1  ORF type:complete len:511 (-),score=58.98 INCI14046.1:1206-2738(-)
MAPPLAPTVSTSSTGSDLEICCICLEPYHEQVSAPVRLNPCGHHVCQPCHDLLRRSSLGRRGLNCPVCRTPVQAWQVDLSILNGSGGGGGGGAARVSAASLHVSAAIGRSTRPHEFIRDRSQIAFYGIDNSGSMGHCDGKTMLSHVPLTPVSNFIEVAAAQCQIQKFQTRWSELAESVKLVALYNLRRGIKAVYMILNPEGSRSVWRDGVDFVIVDPASTGQAQAEQQLRTLFTVLLRADRVEGTTPLDRLTDEFRSKLTAMHRQDQAASNELVSYTLFTDGVPDSKQRFEASLRFLAQECQLGSITVNLTTDDDSVVEYFNSLDTQLGAKTSALEGTRFDVLDDMVAESTEVRKAGNSYVNYCLPIHVCRMAGCNSPVADELDERVLPPHYVAKLCKELVGGLPDSVPHFGTDRAAFVEAIRSRLADMPSFWNPRTRQRQPIFAVNQIDYYLQPNRGLQGQLMTLTGATSVEQLKRMLIFVTLGIVMLAMFFMSMRQPTPYGPGGYRGR